MRLEKVKRCSNASAKIARFSAIIKTNKHQRSYNFKKPNLYTRYKHGTIFQGYPQTSHAQQTTLILPSARVSLLLCRTGAAPEATTCQFCSSTSWRVGRELQLNVRCRSQMTVVYTHAHSQMISTWFAARKDLVGSDRSQKAPSTRQNRWNPGA